MYHFKVLDHVVLQNNMLIIDNIHDEVVVELLYPIQFKDKISTQVWVALRVVNNLNKNNVTPDNLTKINDIFKRACEDSNKIKLGE